MAHEPWSGHYTVDAAIWMHAHWTQFTEIGWKMLTVESESSGFLPAGSGTYVTMVSPDGKDKVWEDKALRQKGVLTVDAIDVGGDDVVAAAVSGGKKRARENECEA